MKKTIKNLLVFVIMFVTFISFNVKVNAKTVSSDEIGANTYVIGTSMFTREQSQTYDGVLTTQRIMLASKTIQGSDLADMVIYYKNARGVWVDAISNQEIATPPSTFKILNVDMEALPDLPAPGMSVQYRLTEENVFVADIFAGASGDVIIECHDDGYGGEECTLKYDYVDIFEVGNDTPVITVPVGGAETYTNVPINSDVRQLIAKPFIMDGENKVYGDPTSFSVGITLATPTIASNPIAPTPAGNVVYYEITISSVDTDIIPGSDLISGAQGVGTPAYAGVDLFKKSDNSYLGTIGLEGQETIFTVGLNNIDANAITTIYGKAFSVVNNAKVYSPASNEITIDKTLPELTLHTASATGSCNEGVCSFDFGVNHPDSAVEATINQTDILKYEGVDLFVVGTDEPVANGSTSYVTVTDVAEGTVATYYVKPYSTVNNSKVYGPASNSIKVVHIGDWNITESSTIKLENHVYAKDISLDLSSNEHLSKFDGFNVYLDNGELTLIESVGINDTVRVSRQDEGQVTITVRLYTLNGEEKIEVASLDGIQLDIEQEGD